MRHSTARPLAIVLFPLIDGDDNRNATVAVSYRKKGELAWKEGLPLLRIGNERINENALQYVTPNGFAGSIFELDPDTPYECRFVMSDPDGIAGKAETIVTVRTRAEPKPAAGGKVYHVHPPASFQQQVQLEAQARERRRFKTLKEFSAATGQDRHSIVVDYDAFVHVTPPGPDPRTLYKPSDFDFALRPGSAAVDAGVRLPGVNDDFTGRAPDLGAYEVGRPLPHYGPRPRPE